MLGFTSLVAASATLSFFSCVSAAGPLVEKTSIPIQPSCTDYTPFEYAGCFTDSGSPNSLVFRTNLPSSGMTIEKCTAFCKGNDYQYAGLEYYGECYCGGTVYGAQATEASCNLPCDGDHTETCGGNNFISVYQDPTYPIIDTSTISDYQSMGCYTDLTGGAGRTLQWQISTIPADSMTVEKCLFACKNGGYDFAGVEYGQECFCGVVLGNGTMQVESSQCTLPCTGNSAEICGDSSRLNLYVALDIESSMPCIGGSPPSASSSSSSASSTTSSSSLSSPSSSSSSSTTSSSTSSLSTSSSSSSTSSSSKPSSTPPSTNPSTSSSSSVVTTTSKTTASTAKLCTATATVTSAPTCEYKCGSWCSTPIPDFVDAKGCATAASSCLVQVTSCFLQAGFPDSLKCFDFANWCSSVSLFGKTYCPGTSCSKSSCKSKYPPTGPAVTTSTTLSIYTCTATTTLSTSTKLSTTTASTSVAIPTASNVCVQPNIPSKGYSSGSPVGGIQLPCLTCNNIQSDYYQFPFKLYTNTDSTKCNSYKSTSNSIIKACQDACDAQYDICMSTYAQSCQTNSGKNGLDNYSQAKIKCQNQQTDCYSANTNTSGTGKCGSWNNGW